VTWPHPERMRNRTTRGGRRPPHAFAVCDRLERPTGGTTSLAPSGRLIAQSREVAELTPNWDRQGSKPLIVTSGRFLDSQYLRVRRRRSDTTA
jgi:hypothetical protein